MGGKGQIEQSLSQIFIKHLLPEIVTVLGNGSTGSESNWVRYAKINSHETEAALLRHTINHLTHELYKSDGKCYPDEMLIRLLGPTPINTGCILKHKESGIFYIVMSPACDLAERKSKNSEGESRKCNTDRAMLVEIQNLDDILNNNEKYKKASIDTQKENIKTIIIWRHKKLIREPYTTIGFQYSILAKKVLPLISEGSLHMMKQI